MSYSMTRTNVRPHRLFNVDFAPKANKAEGLYAKKTKRKLKCHPSVTLIMSVPTLFLVQHRTGYCLYCIVLELIILRLVNTIIVGM